MSEATSAVVRSPTLEQSYGRKSSLSVLQKDVYGKTDKSAEYAAALTAQIMEKAAAKVREMKTPRGLTRMVTESESRAPTRPETPMWSAKRTGWRGEENESDDVFPRRMRGSPTGHGTLSPQQYHAELE